MRILLIEDDSILGNAVRDQVRADGHSIDWATRLDEARESLAVAAYDLSNARTAASVWGP